MNQTKKKGREQPKSKNGMVNGIKLEALMETVNAIKADPQLGLCQFRAKNKWLGGSHNRSTVSSFYGAKQEIAHKQKFEMHADEPAILAGKDKGANPVEHLLHALASCITTSMVAHAAVRGIHVEAVESELEGDIDLRGFLGLADNVPKGYTDIRVKFRVKADPKDVKRLKELSMYSPVFNTLTKGVPVHLQIEAK